MPEKKLKKRPGKVLFLLKMQKPQAKEERTKKLKKSKIPKFAQNKILFNINI